MMKKKTFTYLFLSILMGIGAAVLADNWIQQRIAPAPSVTLEYEPIVIAAMDIPFGQKIETNQLKLMEWPKTVALPTGAIQTFEDVEGHVANQTIYSGEMVLSSRVVEHTSGSTLSAIITPNKRAITLRVNDVVGVAGFLLPGNRIDVLASRKVDNKRVSTKTLLQDLKVLAVDQTVSPEKDKPIVVRAVTIEAGPKEAEKLFKATEEGSVQLVLRNPTDRAPEVVRVEEDPDEKPAPRVAAVPVKPRVKDSGFSAVTVIRGTHVDVARTRF
jgi:pilus assembly protein CpaB